MEQQLFQTPKSQKKLQLTPDHVRDLSLKETTDSYGSLGLYTKLDYELEVSGLADIPEIEFAKEFGLMLHANDQRTSGHYGDHIMRVGLRIMTSYKITDAAIIAASFLHDSVEDHPYDIGRSLGSPCPEGADPQAHALSILARYIGEETAGIIALLTVPKFTPETKQEQYTEYTRNIVSKSPKARVIKLSDFVDNAVGNHYTSGSKRAKLDRKYLPLYRVHQMGLFMPDSLIVGEERDMALKQLTKAHYRAMGRLSLLEEAV